MSMLRGVVALKGLILDNFHLGRVLWFSSLGACSDPERTDSTIFTLGGQDYNESTDFVSDRPILDNFQFERYGCLVRCNFGSFLL